MKQAIDGWLLIDKPTGITSNDVLIQLKKKFHPKKIGHTGSLDPLATGVLPVCFGEASKFSQFLLDADKCYQVTFKLGERTDTSDSDGEVVAVREVPSLTAKQLEWYLDSFKGVQPQTPSIYSALKYQGKPLYYYARKGIEVPRPTRSIEVFSLQLLRFDGDEVTLMVHCSKGTYIRTLVDDLGEAIGCGAHVTALRRTAVDQFSIAQACQLEQVELNGVLPIDIIFKNWPKLELTIEQKQQLYYGQPIVISEVEHQCALYCDKIFFGVGAINAAGQLVSQRLLAALR